MRTRRLLLISCAPRRRGRDGLRRDPKLALNLLLDEPAKLLEELFHSRNSPSLIATGLRARSTSATAAPVGLQMSEVGRPACPLPAVWTGAHGGEV